MTMQKKPLLLKMRNWSGCKSCFYLTVPSGTSEKKKDWAPKTKPRLDKFLAKAVHYPIPSGHAISTMTEIYLSTI